MFNLIKLFLVFIKIVTCVDIPVSSPVEDTTEHQNPQMIIDRLDKINSEDCRDHLPHMKEIQNFFKNVSELECVRKKRQNIQMGVGIDPFDIFN